MFTNFPPIPPERPERQTFQVSENISLRDYFAGQCLIGLSRETATVEDRARHAYKQADAMLAAREADIEQERMAYLARINSDGRD